VGSVLPLAAPDLAQGAPGGIWDAWTSKGAVAAAFRTARSALAGLLSHRQVKRLWAPAYVCTAVGDAAHAAGCELRFFAVDPSLQPDLEGLSTAVVAGDAVLMVDYFGRPPAPAFEHLVRARPEILWIEDRAQALRTGPPPWGDVILYSPRKLIGVGDGGVLIGADSLPAPTELHQADGLWEPHIGRQQDPRGEQAAVWYGAFKAREDRFAVDRAAMSPLTRSLLERTAIAPQVQARKANFTALAQKLGDLALWPDVVSPDFAPLALPIRVRDAETMAARLAERRIFCARHWATLPSPADVFPEAHRLSKQLLSVPCDPTYSPDELTRVADVVLALA
jgi:dTDP-4-amino-4,6-dideoxygalactose transaminase